eukprot:SAG31_NODE_7977_length_1550_cov_1.508615_2_plen_91_part_00
MAGQEYVEDNGGVMPMLNSFPSTAQMEVLSRRVAGPENIPIKSDDSVPSPPGSEIDCTLSTSCTQAGRFHTCSKKQPKAVGRSSMVVPSP